MNWLLEHAVLTDQLYNRLDRLREDIGKLDDVVESTFIDCRIEGGAYQLLGRALDKLEQYQDYLENDVDVSLTPTGRGI